MSAAVEAQRALDAYYGVGQRPAPIDPVQIARALGINVYSLELENELSGMIAKLDPQGDVNMFVNNQHAAVRQRFTVAHELGHYFANQQFPDADKRTYIHRRNSLSACGTYGEEIFANQFAAELLMPANEVRSLVDLGFDRTALAARFHVSLDAIGHRLRNLRLA